MEKEKNELNPCPFCGGKASVRSASYHYTSNEWGDDWYVVCNKCKIQATVCKTSVKRMNTGELVILNDGRAEAIMKWNTRAEVHNETL